MLHYDIKITGNVQGVGLRYSCSEIARKLGIFGFVRNETDGSVFLEAEGEDEKVELFLESLKKDFSHFGPLSVQAATGKTKGYREFEIKFVK